MCRDLIRGGVVSQLSSLIHCLPYLDEFMLWSQAYTSHVLTLHPEKSENGRSGGTKRNIKGFEETKRGLANSKTKNDNKKGKERKQDQTAGRENTARQVSIALYLLS